MPRRLSALPDVLAVVLVLGAFWLPPALQGQAIEAQALDAQALQAQAPRLAAGLVLAAVAGTAMLLRRRLPRTATVVAGLATVVGNLLGVCEDPMLATAWCLYAVAVARAARTSEVLLVLALLSAGLAAVTGVPPGGASGLGQRLVVAVAALSVAWLLGTAVGRQIGAAREAERARVQLEVAREVHDVVGHALGAISAEAGVTRGLADAREPELRESLAEIESHARRALEEIQQLVRGLRAGPEHQGPAGSVAQLSTLVDTARAAGAEVTARIAVDEPVDDAVGAVAFRIVQESLSNVVRHAPGATCSVEVRKDGDALTVRVRDRGPGAGATGRSGSGRSGFGLPGMRERASLVGGTVSWGDHPGGGFEVRASLPVRGGAR